MGERYPGYDVLAKRDGPSWNDKTRAVIEARLAIDAEARRFFDDREWQTLKAVCARLIPQEASRDRPVPLAAMVDAKMHRGVGDGYRNAKLPRMQEAWRIGLAALDAEAMVRNGRRFHELDGARQDSLLRAMQQGELDHPRWDGMPPKVFFKDRLLHDVVSAYYSHPSSWNEIGFGGPASPRGYVRMNFDMRDPWEAAEAYPEREAQALERNRRVR